jgi:hypothetical protein
MACFVLILVMTWYLTTRHHDTAVDYAHKIVGAKPGAKPESQMGSDWRREVLDD